MQISSPLTLTLILFRLVLPAGFELCVIHVNAQQSDYLIKSFGVNQGLAHPNVRSIVKDSTGFLWIGTFDGLSRFDGNEFVNYRHSPDDPGSIPPNDIRKLCVDWKNRLWILNQGVIRLDRASDEFITYPETMFNPASKDNHTWMNLDHHGMIWVLMTNEFLFYDDVKDKFVPVPIINSTFLSTLVKSCYIFNFDEKGQVWIIGDDNVYYCQVTWLSDMVPSSVRIIDSFKIIHQVSTPYYTVELEHAVTQSDYGTFLFSNLGLYQLHQAKKAFFPVTTVADKKWFFGSRSFTWFDTKKGLHTWNSKMKALTTIIQSELLLVETAYADADDSWWFSGLDLTLNGIGIRHAIPLTKSFYHYFQEFKGEQTAVFAIYREKNGNFWVGNRSKLPLVHLNANGVPDRDPPFFPFDDSRQILRKLSKTQVRAISKDSLGNIWFGFLHNYLFYLPDNSWGLRQFLPDPVCDEGADKIIPNNRQILPLKNGKLLVGGDVSMNLINPGELTIDRHIPFPVNLMGYGMYASFQDNLGAVWIGHGGSILRKYNQELWSLDSVRLSTDSYNLECITGNADTLWIASMGGGLIRYIPKDHSVKFYSTHQGLSNNYTYHILPDKHKNLWISTNEGISVFNTKTEIFHNYGEPEGLKIREFNADAGFLAPDGRMFFGGMGGFVGFYPDSVYAGKRISTTGPLLITRVSVSGNRKLFPVPVYQLDSIKLEKGENNLCLTFSKFDFRYPQEVVYRYMLDGVDAGWTITRSDNRNANYAGLSHGIYRFIVEAADETGNWSQQKDLVIIIPAFYYQTIWFKLSVTILALFLITLFLWMKYKQVRLLNLKRLETLRMKSLQAQLNPHFIFNSLNSIGYLISNKPQEVADQYVADFASLMRSFLDNSSRDFILLSEEIESIEHYLALEYLRLHEKFDYRVECSPGLEPEASEVVPSLIQPFIENAIWHGVGLLKGRKGTIVVKFTKNSPNLIICTVEDDGIGRIKAGLLKSEDYRKRQSKGVGLILDRLKIINSLYKSDYQIVIEDLKPWEEETGTKVTIPLPVRAA